MQTTSKGATLVSPVSVFLLLLSGCGSPPTCVMSEDFCGEVSIMGDTATIEANPEVTSLRIEEGDTGNSKHIALVGSGDNGLENVTIASNSVETVTIEGFQGILAVTVSSTSLKSLERTDSTFETFISTNSTSLERVTLTDESVSQLSIQDIGTDFTSPSIDTTWSSESKANIAFIEGFTPSETSISWLESLASQVEECFLTVPDGGEWTSSLTEESYR